jgi:hypothetical protein
MIIYMTRARVTITLSREILDRVDRAVRRTPRASRSSVVEEWLAGAARREAERELDRAIADYYDGMSASERAEDASWARLSTRSFMVREQGSYQPGRSTKKGARR